MINTNTKYYLRIGTVSWFLFISFSITAQVAMPSGTNCETIGNQHSLGITGVQPPSSNSDAGHTSNKTSGIVVTQSICLMRDAERVLTGSTRCMEQEIKSPEIVLGGIVRGDASVKQLSLVFTGHEFADGATTIRDVLRENAITGAFFLTGDFYRLYPSIARDLQHEGHYMAPHSDKHLLYADWGNRDSTLVSKEEFEKDLHNNYRTMEEIGLRIDSPRYFMPPYEWYNQEISDWAKAMDVQIVNFTPGTTSNADYTTPDMKSYRSSETIYNNILKYEEDNGLNGFMLLIHIGTAPRRTDKLYNRLSDLVDELHNRGYSFVPITELLKE